MLCALCYILLLLLNFPRAQSLLCIWSPVRNVHHTNDLYSLSGTGCQDCILSAVLLHFSCTESAKGLHSETSGLPRLAGLQSYRKPLWCYPTLLQDMECTSAGCFVVLPLKIESDKCNSPICLLAFPIKNLGCMHKVNIKSAY